MESDLPITDAERLVMEAVWQDSPATSKDIVRRVSAREAWQPKTVQTLIGRLVKKGMLQHEKQGRGYLYSATLPREEFVRRKSRQFVRTFFRGRVTPLVAAFAEADSLSSDDLRELRDFVESMEEHDGEEEA